MAKVLVNPETVQVFHQLALVVDEKRFVVVFEIVRQSQYLELVQGYQFVEQEQVER